MVSQCFLNEALFALHSQGFFAGTIDNDYITTDVVAGLLGNGIFDKFDHGQ